jgi:hypothetical protein
MTSNDTPNQNNSQNTNQGGNSTASGNQDGGGRDTGRQPSVQQPLETRGLKPDRASETKDK